MNWLVNLALNQYLQQSKTYRSRNQIHRKIALQFLLFVKHYCPIVHLASNVMVSRKRSFIEHCLWSKTTETFGDGCLKYDKSIDIIWMNLNQSVCRSLAKVITRNRTPIPPDTGGCWLDNQSLIETLNELSS